MAFSCERSGARPARSLGAPYPTCVRVSLARVSDGLLGLVRVAPDSGSHASSTSPASQACRAPRAPVPDLQTAPVRRRQQGARRLLHNSDPPESPCRWGSGCGNGHPNPRHGCISRMITRMPSPRCRPAGLTAVVTSPTVRPNLHRGSRGRPDEARIPLFQCHTELALNELGSCSDLWGR